MFTIAGASAARTAADAAAEQRELAAALRRSYRRQRNYQAAALSEPLTAAVLQPLADRGWRVLHDRRWPGSSRAGLIIGALGRLVVPGKQNIPIWLTMVVGIIAALIGTAIARALGVADTRGFDWIEPIIQVVLAAIGVTIAANAYARRGIRR